MLKNSTSGCTCLYSSTYSPTCNADHQTVEEDDEGVGRVTQLSLVWSKHGDGQVQLLSKIQALIEVKTSEIGDQGGLHAVIVDVHDDDVESELSEANIVSLNIREKYWVETEKRELMMMMRLQTTNQW